MELSFTFEKSTMVNFLLVHLETDQRARHGQQHRHERSSQAMKDLKTRKKQKMSSESNNEVHVAEPSELLTFIMRQLSALGMTATASQLQLESGIAGESEKAIRFKRAVNSGDWDAVLIDCDERCVDAVRRQQYLEAVERGEMDDAVELLQEMHINHDQLEVLAP
jgi:hypothetical protein